MPKGITLIETPERLEETIDRSFSRPQLIFKHSLTCGLSAWALEEFNALLDEGPLPIDACLVQIQLSRPVSNAVAERLGVRHASPQALLVVAGSAVWHASHDGLTRDAMEAAINAHPVGECAVAYPFTP